VPQVRPVPKEIREVLESLVQQDRLAHRVIRDLQVSRELPVQPDHRDLPESRVPRARPDRMELPGQLVRKESRGAPESLERPGRKAPRESPGPLGRLGPRVIKDLQVLRVQPVRKVRLE
jgi:hypothetical protein